MHQVATCRVQFDPLSVPAILSDLTNRASSLHDTDTTASLRCGDVGQTMQGSVRGHASTTLGAACGDAKQAVRGSVQGYGHPFRFRHNGGDTSRPFRVESVQLEGGAFVQPHH